MSNPYLKRLNSFGRRRPTNLTCISLFSGGGGLDLGAYLARFRTLLASDIKPAELDKVFVTHCISINFIPNGRKVMALIL